jgi:hypothetical protein
MGVTFTIKGSLPSMNEIIEQSKQHWSVYRKSKETYTNMVAWACYKVPRMKKVDLTITWFCEDRRKDPDNIASALKYVCDGLVVAGVLENDGWNEIGEIHHSFKVDKDNPRIVVELVEVKP